MSRTGKITGSTSYSSTDWTDKPSSISSQSWTTQPSYHIYTDNITTLLSTEEAVQELPGPTLIVLHTVSNEKVYWYTTGKTCLHVGQAVTLRNCPRVSENSGSLKGLGDHLSTVPHSFIQCKHHSGNSSPNQTDGTKHNKNLQTNKVSKEETTAGRGISEIGNQTTPNP